LFTEKTATESICIEKKIRNFISYVMPRYGCIEELEFHPEYESEAIRSIGEAT
jgi:hypothetical protein